MTLRVIRPVSSIGTENKAKESLVSGFAVFFARGRFA